MTNYNNENGELMRCILKPRWYNNQKREYDNVMRRYEWLDNLVQLD